MSAVEEYRREVASRGLPPVTNDGSILALVDAAIAEMEVEIAGSERRRLRAVADREGALVAKIKAEAESVSLLQALAHYADEQHDVNLRAHVAAALKEARGGSETRE